MLIYKDNVRTLNSSMLDVFFFLQLQEFLFWLTLIDKSHALEMNIITIIII